MKKTIGLNPFLHIRSAKNPIYHPNNTSLSFITDYTGIPQVWELKNNHTWPFQISHNEERVIFVDYIKGTRERIIGMDKGVNERQQLFLLKDDGDMDALTNSPDHIHHYGGCSPDGKQIAWSSNRRHSTYFDIYIQDLETKNIHMVFADNGTYHVKKWHPEGHSLLIEHVHSNLDNDLGLLNFDTGKVTWVTQHKGEAIFQTPHFNKDGSMLYFLTNLEREFTGLAQLSLKTNDMTWLDRRDWDLEGLTINHQKNVLAYTINHGGISQGGLYNLDTSTKTTWQMPVGVMTELSFSPDDEKLAFVFNGASHPPDIWELTLETESATQRTFVSHSPIVQEHLVEPEVIHFESFDGLEIPAFYYKPKNHDDQPLPVVIFVHGGPESQIRSVYNPFLQYFIHRGYAVCTPNVRGSSGYGKTYSHLDDVRKRMDAVKDLTSLVDWLTKQGGADPKKIAIMGRSYGGFMVLAAVTHYPDLWACGVDIVGISSFKSFLKNTSPWRRKLREAEYGSLQSDGDFFDKIDPIHYTNNITCPLMLLHGANDPRVPIEETEQIVKELTSRHHPVDYIRFEDEGHFFVKLKNNITAYTGVAHFLERYL